MPVHQCNRKSHNRGFFTLVALLSVLVCGGCDRSAASNRENPDASESNGAVTAPNEAAPQRVVDKTFDDIKFEMDKENPWEREMLTDQIEQIAGKKIRIRGFIYPTFRSKGIKSFVLVRDDKECCFGPGAALFDCIRVEMAAGDGIKYTRRPVAVEGTFNIDPFLGPDGKHLAIYHLAADAVE